jgi:hypothetical protein
MIRGDGHFCANGMPDGARVIPVWGPMEGHGPHANQSPPGARGGDSSRLSPVPSIPQAEGPGAAAATHCDQLCRLRRRSFKRRTRAQAKNAATGRFGNVRSRILRSPPAVLAVIAFGLRADVLPTPYQPLGIFGTCAGDTLFGAGTACFDQDLASVT